ncbi:MAG: hypothetical protein Kow0068_10130 [Marinilabiliales bacterium]
MENNTKIVRLLKTDFIMKKTVWLIGAGNMAKEYVKVLKDIYCDFIVIGRSEENAIKFKEETGVPVIAGGLNKFIQSQPDKCTHAIVALGVEALADTTLQILNYGIKNILVEKPGALYKNDLTSLQKIAKEKNANVFIAYNRRFYASVIKAMEIIENDGGVTSFNFEFTEWSHVIEPLKKADGVKERWFLANSTHVVDLAFFLGGSPVRIETFTAGKLKWHPSASIFSGAGISDKNALFSYQANWESAGRWSVEILTPKNRLIFRPMEKLQIQKRGEITTSFVNIDYSLDEKYKPGLFLQTRNFLNGNSESLCSLDEQVSVFDIYEQIANYGK